MIVAFLIFDTIAYYLYTMETSFKANSANTNLFSRFLDAFVQVCAPFTGDVLFSHDTTFRQRLKATGPEEAFQGSVNHIVSELNSAVFRVTSKK